MLNSNSSSPNSGNTHVVCRAGKGDDFLFFKRFDKDVIQYRVFAKFIEHICKIYGFNTVEFFEQDGANFLENKVTVRLRYVEQ